MSDSLGAPVDEVVEADFAIGLAMTRRTLVHDLPSTLTALADGRLGWRHAQILVDNSYGLPAATVATLETAVLGAAEGMTPSQFEREVRKAREKIDPGSMVERQVQAEIGRCVTIFPESDGMATITACLPVVQAVAIDARLTDIARSLQTSDEPRTLTQLRADAFSDILLDADGGADAGHATTAGSGDGPTLQRLLSDPVSGAILAIGRNRYRIPEDIRTWLRVRDGTCRFPGCSRSAVRCDIDHTANWAYGKGFGGAPGESPGDGSRDRTDDGADDRTEEKTRNRTCGTDHWNLAHLCPGHHTIKHATGWRVKQARDGSGTLSWTSPAGMNYMTYPKTQVGPYALA